MELSILAYARFHGIARDHLGLDHNNLIPHASTKTTASLDDPDDPSLVSVRNAQLTALEGQNEKLDITRSGAIFLSSILQTPTYLEKAGSEIRWDALLPDYRLIKRLKVEEPLLKGDHELNMRAFRNQTNLNQMDVEISIEQLDDENDEGLGFPTYCRDLPGQMQDRIAQEKLDCSRTVLQFMQDIRQPWSGSMEDAHKQVYDRINWSPTKRCESITPPLLPREPSSGSFIPASSRLKLELCSELEPRALPEYESVDRLLAEDLELNDEGAENSVGEVQGKSFLSSLGYSPSMPPNPNTLISPKRPLPYDLKVDTPITPPVSTKKRCLQEQGKSLIDLLEGVSFPSWLAPESKQEQLLDEKLVKVVQFAKIEVERRMKTECFRQIDPSVRAEVPDLEIPQVLPPWVRIPGSPSGVQNDVQRLISKLLANYDLTSGLETQPPDERQLPWNPFPGGIKRLDVEQTVQSLHPPEDFLVDSYLGAEDGNYFMFTPPQLPPPKDDTESEILPRDFARELNGDLSNRGFTHGSPRTAMDALKFGNTAEGSLRNDPERKVISEDGTRTVQRGYVKANPLCSNFSTSRRLANFMNIRGYRGSGSGIHDSPTSGPSLTWPNEAHHHEKQSQSYTSNQNIDTRDELKDLILPVPDIPLPSTRRTLVISCSLLRSHRTLVRYLEALVPPAILIFRDYGKSNSSWPTGQTLPSSNTISPGSNSAKSDGSTNLGDNEADIILSPTVGILLTTSQESTQLYLPGHQSSPTSLGVKCDSPLRERISRCCVRYEQIYLFICHTSLTDCNELTIDSKRTDSVRSLQSFCHTLSPHCLIMPLLVPSSPASLTNWITSLSTKHTFTLPSWARDSFAPEFSFLSPEDPTVSELSLHRAGLNPFAAQVVLYLCSSRVVSATADVFPFSEGNFALQDAIKKDKLLQASFQDAFERFVDMDPHERQRKFAPVIGHRVLSRLEKQLGILLQAASR